MPRRRARLNIDRLRPCICNNGEQVPSKRPSALAEIFRTDDATLKMKLAARGLAVSYGPGGALGRAWSALVFIKLKE